VVRARSQARDGGERARWLSSAVRPQINGVTYARLEVIGKGGSSKVFRVMTQTGKILAVKRVDLAGADDFARTSYTNEIQLLQRLRGNDSIVTLYDAQVDEAHSLIYMVMECGEIDLARLLAKRANDKGLNENFIRLYWQQVPPAGECMPVGY
jgi:serine/threonine-protein kinase TTK/MPS1